MIVEQSNVFTQINLNSSQYSAITFGEKVRKKYQTLLQNLVNMKVTVSE